MAPAYIGTIHRHLGFLDRHEKERLAKTVLAEVSHNTLAQESLRHHHSESFSEKITVFLMRRGRFELLRLYRKLADAVKRSTH